MACSKPNSRGGGLYTNSLRHAMMDGEREPTIVVWKARELRWTTKTISVIYFIFIWFGYVTIWTFWSVELCSRTLLSNQPTQCNNPVCKLRYFWPFCMPHRYPPRCIWQISKFQRYAPTPLQSLMVCTLTKQRKRKAICTMCDDL